MTPITMFTMSTCPHCQKAYEMMQKIVQENPAYSRIPLSIIDEVANMDYANTFDYYYVPTFYVGGQKLHEGVPSVEAIRKVYQAAARQKG